MTGSTNLITSYNYTSTANFTGGQTNLSIARTMETGVEEAGAPGYHYIAVKVSDSSSSSETGWLVPNSIIPSHDRNSQQRSISRKTANATTTINVTTPGTVRARQKTLPHLPMAMDNNNGREENYNFTVGSCTLQPLHYARSPVPQHHYQPRGGWLQGYNYL